DNICSKAQKQLCAFVVRVQIFHCISFLLLIVAQSTTGDPRLPSPLRIPKPCPIRSRLRISVDNVICNRIVKPHYINNKSFFLKHQIEKLELNLTETGKL